MEQIVAVILLLIIIVFIFKKLKKQPDTELNEHQKKIIKIGDDVVDTFQTSYKKIKKKSEIIISKSYLTGCNWYLENDLDEDIIYTFRNNDEILITKNGIVERRKYEFIVDNNSLIISNNNQSEMFFIENLKDNCLMLYKISSKEMLIFSNHTKFKDTIKSEFKNQEKSNQFENKTIEFDFDDYLMRQSFVQTRIREKANNDPYEYIRQIENKYEKTDIEIIKQMDIWLNENPNSPIGMNQKNTMVDYIIMLEDKYNVG